jgi:hypothetical protein
MAESHYRVFTKLQFRQNFPGTCKYRAMITVYSETLIILEKLNKLKRSKHATR